MTESDDRDDREDEGRERVLVVATSGIPPNRVARAIGDRIDPDAIVRVVGTASGLSRLSWLTNDEDSARADAADRAETLADAIPQADVEATQGDTDPLRAIEDEVHLFAPTRIVVVTLNDDDATWLETGVADSARTLFDVPVTHVVAA
jgi:GABA permease